MSRRLALALALAGLALLACGHKSSLFLDAGRKTEGKDDAKPTKQTGPPAGAKKP